MSETRKDALGQIGKLRLKERKAVIDTLPLKRSKQMTRLLVSIGKESGLRSHRQLTSFTDIGFPA